MARQHVKLHQPRECMSCYRIGHRLCAHDSLLCHRTRIEGIRCKSDPVPNARIAHTLLFAGLLVVLQAGCVTLDSLLYCRIGHRLCVRRQPVCLRHPVTSAVADAAGKCTAVFLSPLFEAATHSETAGRHHRLSSITATSIKGAAPQEEFELKLICPHAGNL